MPRAISTAILALALADPAVGQSPSPLRTRLVGHAPPELVADRENWLAGPPATVKGLRGRVVWLQFNPGETCAPFREHLVRWEAEFRGCGLTVVEVSGGRDADLAASRDRLARSGVGHPVLWDRDNKLSVAYATAGRSAAYRIGADGRVFWQGNPAAFRGRGDDEAAFRQALVAELGRARREQ
ncbi:MAG TPA: hypothetical protein VM597_09915 [Gemmataceae bacterium]|jgi:hypothetical protein|nr:hypothetical protein [Gemmataceae bacterium]